MLKRFAFASMSFALIMFCQILFAQAQSDANAYTFDFTQPISGAALYNPTIPNNYILNFGDDAGLAHYEIAECTPQAFESGDSDPYLISTGDYLATDHYSYIVGSTCDGHQIKGASFATFSSFEGPDNDYFGGPRIYSIEGDIYIPQPLEYLTTTTYTPSYSGAPPKSSTVIDHKDSIDYYISLSVSDFSDPSDPQGNLVTCQSNLGKFEFAVSFGQGDGNVWTTDSLEINNDLIRQSNGLIHFVANCSRPIYSVDVRGDDVGELFDDPVTDQIYYFRPYAFITNLTVHLSPFYATFFTVDTRKPPGICPIATVSNQSQINMNNLSLSEDISLVGIPFSLSYASDRSSGYAAHKIDARTFQLGGWYLSGFDYYDSGNGVLYSGDGGIRHIQIDLRPGFRAS